MAVSWETLLVGLGGAIIGGSFSLIGAQLKYKGEIKKLQFSYQHSTNQTYIQNARSKQEDLYIPLYSHLSLLEDKYSEVRNLFAIRGDTVGEVGAAALSAFKDTHEKLSISFDIWQQSGMTAFMIYNLEEKTRLLINFLKNSFASGKVQIERSIYVTFSTPVKDFSFSFPFFKFKRFITEAVKKEKVVFNSSGNDYGLNLGILPGWLGTKIGFTKQFISAPVSSSEFEKQFIEYVATIKQTIKEVTLGKS